MKWAIAVIIVGSAVLLGGVIGGFCLYQGSRRFKLVQRLVNLHKRVKGEPTAGVISIVNTDIEGYSGGTQGGT